MGRSFVISLALLAGCWDDPQLRLDVSRADTSANLAIWVCEPDDTRCTHNDAFPDMTEITRHVSIFTSSPAILLWLEVGSSQQECIDVQITSHELVRDVAIGTNALMWCARTSNCETPRTMCPAQGPQ